jgi:16S rRNA (adenine1518-N6/adenine1519-N6)-dimethyltransferase
LIKAKKSLGQNFLIDHKILETIVNTIDIKNKAVLEIGPGTGNLTNYIFKKKPNKVLVIEKDNKLAEDLRSKYLNNLQIINDDVLNINESSLLKEKVIVFGNLPYNISTEILSKWIVNLRDNFWFEALVLMFQKEVADRIVANINSSGYGRLTILANWKLNISKIIDIKPNSFKPKPKVDSSLLFFTPKKDFYKIKNPKNLEKITRIFFSNRRKMIKKPYNQIFNGDVRVLENLKINLNLRPQNLSFDTYYKLTEEYEKLIG